MNAPREIQVKFDDVRSGYLTRTKTVRARLEKLADLLKTGGDEETIEEIEEIVHRIAGSAGTFGLSKIGEQAARAERAALALRRGKASRSELAVAVKKLSAVIGTVK
jgi:HPt (histidine-containing phosphotransfer) domain-containing protein